MYQNRGDKSIRSSRWWRSSERVRVMSNRKWFSKNPFRKLLAKFRRKQQQAPCSCNSMDDMSERVVVLSLEDEDEAIKVHPREIAEWKPHTQVDYIHHLVPGLQGIISSAHYWGKMDRYEAESELENKPEGSFLLRDSAQDDYIFSVSFRRYGRSLHARIEESGHKFSFDCHDPGVFRSDSIPALLHHYKDPTSCMFFEPLLCCPVNRTKPFSLQDLSRATICDSVGGYSKIDSLELPRPLKLYLKEYHYKHKVRTVRLD